MPKRKKLDIHYIITHILNVRLSDFLTRHKVGERKVIETVTTGGVKV